MTWNYRVMRQIWDEPFGPTPVYGIVEAYESGAWSERFQEPFGGTLEELRETLRLMTEALDKPPLDVDGKEIVDIS